MNRSTVAGRPNRPSRRPRAAATGQNVDQNAEEQSVDQSVDQSVEEQSGPSAVVRRRRVRRDHGWAHRRERLAYREHRRRQVFDAFFSSRW